MTAAAESVRCPHCSTDVPPRELAEGWCDSCGKRLPDSIRTQVKRSQSATKQPGEAAAGSPRRRALVWASLAAAACAAAGAVVFFNLV